MQDSGGIASSPQKQKKTRPSKIVPLPSPYEQQLFETMNSAILALNLRDTPSFSQGCDPTVLRIYATGGKELFSNYLHAPAAEIQAMLASFGIKALKIEQKNIPPQLSVNIEQANYEHNLGMLKDYVLEISIEALGKAPLREKQKKPANTIDVKSTEALDRIDREYRREFEGR